MSKLILRKFMRNYTAFGVWMFGLLRSQIFVRYLLKGETFALGFYTIKSQTPSLDLSGCV